MARDSRNRWLAAGAVLAVALVAWFVLREAPPPTTDATGEGASERSTLAGGDDGGSAPGASHRRAERPLGKDPATADAEAAEYLREQFGATIDNKRTQIKAIEKLIEYLMKNYPDDWQQRLQALLAQAFPGLADQLFAQYQNMTAYNEWLKASHDQLAAMSPSDKRDALRDARFRFFGADAAEIWEETLRHERIYDAMDSIEQSHGTSVGDKLQTYLDAINETYGEQAPQFLEKRQTELMNNFLALPAVQDDLHSMSPQEREQQLGRIRSAMGMDDAALERWRELDDQRDQAWEAGQRYMAKRDEITRSTQGDEQARRLTELRSQMFGDDAETIHGEEDAGFFRFGHSRAYGKE